MKHKGAEAQRLIKLIAALIIVTLTMGIAHRAAAQQALTIETLLIQLWPEYDQPSMLVQYTGQMNTADEVSLTFTLPEGADLHVTAYVDAERGYIEIPNPVVDGDQVTITTPNGSFHVEFYDEIAIDGVQREYAITWAGDYAVTTLQWDLQMPPESSEVEITPRANGPIQQGALDHYFAVGSGLGQGEGSPFAVRYRRSSDVLAVDSAPAEPLSDAETSDAGNNPILIAALVIALVGMIGAGAYAYLRSGQKPPATSRQRSAKGKRQERAAESASQGGRFCTKCGTAAQAEDKFCRKCGAALRG